MNEPKGYEGKTIEELGFALQELQQRYEVALQEITAWKKKSEDQFNDMAFTIRKINRVLTRYAKLNFASAETPSSRHKRKKG